MDTLRHAMWINFHRKLIKAKDISARSLQAGGAMTMLFGKIDMHSIRLIGRWHSDATMCPPPGQAHPIIGGFAAEIYDSSAYTFKPDETAPIIDSYGD
jgi:hypothetical protein